MATATEPPRTGLLGLLSRLFGRPGANERKEICHQCGKEGDIDMRQCPHCGAKMVPQSRWDKL
jgi:predicted amidophosphoribosyltransferase